MQETAKLILTMELVVAVSAALADKPVLHRPVGTAGVSGNLPAEMCSPYFRLYCFHVPGSNIRRSSLRNRLQALSPEHPRSG
jgi:hypothetical protein